MRKYRFLAFIFSLVQTSPMLAADPDFYRSTGKIYGAYVCALILVVGLILYLFSVDRKLSRIEREIDNDL